MTDITTRRLASDAAKAAADRKAAVDAGYLAAFAAMAEDPTSALSFSMDLAERQDDSDEAYDAYVDAAAIAAAELTAAYNAFEAAASRY